MPERELELGHLVTPQPLTPEPGSAALPGVVMIPDVWGLSEHYRELAARLAGEGFAVLAVDPYRKTGCPELGDPASALAWIREIPDPVMLETLQEARDFLAADAAVQGLPIGITGFCMGGQYAILAACSGRGFAACAPFYGMLRYETELDPARKPRSPLEALVDLPCPFLGLYGEQDHLIPLTDVAELRERLVETGRPFDLRLYPGAGHAFMNESREELYRPEAAADAWPRLVQFLKGALSEGTLV